MQIHSAVITWRTVFILFGWVAVGWVGRCWVELDWAGFLGQVGTGSV